MTDPGRQPASLGKGWGRVGSGKREAGAPRGVGSDVKPAVNFQSKHWVVNSKAKLPPGPAGDSELSGENSGAGCFPTSCPSGWSCPKTPLGLCIPRWYTSCYPIVPSGGPAWGLRVALTPSLLHTLWCVCSWLWKVRAGEVGSLLDAGWGASQEGR